jgi:integrase
MSRVVLTDKKVTRLKPAKPGTRYDVRDALVPNLLVRVTDKGSKAFVFRTRYPGKPYPSRRVIGKVGALGIEQARDKARKWHELLAEHTDPAWQAEQDRLAALRSQQHTFLLVAEAYFAHIKVEGFKKARVHEREIRKEFVSQWEARPIHDITQHDLAAVINAIKQRGSPGQAREIYMRAKSLWRWAIGCGAYGLTASPADRLGTKALVGSKKSRSRVLSDDELRALWQAVEQEQPPWQPLYKLLIMSGQRLSDVSNASWPEFNFERKLWTIAAERYKTGAPQVVPLTKGMLALLDELPRFETGEFLFSASWGRSPVANFSKPKLRLNAYMKAALPKMPDWVVHDIRRTVRSHLSALPVEQHVRELVIGHLQVGVKATYDRYAYLEEKRRALELWQARLRDIVKPPPANVTNLRVRKKA